MSTPVTPNDKSGNSGPGNDRTGNDTSRTTATSDRTASSTTRPTNSPTAKTPDHREVVSRQKEQFGGMKFGCAFFGWLTATGTAVLLTGLLAAVGAALGLNPTVDPAAPPTGDVRTAGLVGAIIAGAVVLIAYFCGGYVAARMARFNGLKQGLGVWLWALVAAVVVTILALTLGDRTNMLTNLGGSIPVPVSSNTLTTGGIITAIAIIVVSLIGALLGGLAGMRFHRRVDRAGFDSTGV